MVCALQLVVQCNAVCLQEFYVRQIHKLITNFLVLMPLKVSRLGDDMVRHRPALLAALVVHTMLSHNVIHNAICIVCDHPRLGIFCHQPLLMTVCINIDF